MLFLTMHAMQMVSRDTTTSKASGAANRKAASKVRSRENLHIAPAPVEPARPASDDDDDPDRMDGPTMMDGAFVLCFR